MEQNVARADMTAGQRSLNEQIIVTRDISAGVQVAGELDAAADDAAIGDDSASAGNALDMNIAGTSHCTIVDNQLIAGNVFASSVPVTMVVRERTSSANVVRVVTVMSP